MIDAGLYGEDEWRLRPNMSLSYGLRFETQSHISDHADLAPRVSYSWGLGRGKTPPKTVLRAGWGIFYDRFAYDLALQAERLNGNPANRSSPDGRQLAKLFLPERSQSSFRAVRHPQRSIRLLPICERLTPCKRESAWSGRWRRAPPSRSRISIRGESTNCSPRHQRNRPDNRRAAARRHLRKHECFCYDSSGIFRQNQFIANMRVSIGSQAFAVWFLFAEFRQQRSRARRAIRRPYRGSGGGFSSGGSLSLRGFCLIPPIRWRTTGGRHSMCATVPCSVAIFRCLMASGSVPSCWLLPAGHITSRWVNKILNGDSLFLDRPAFATGRLRLQHLAWF